jgi:4-hydroxybenzoate polyprenyltransferase
MARSTSSPVAVPDAPASGVSGKPIVLNLIIALRPGQWTKNLLVFAGLIFGMQLFVPSAVIRAIGAFVIFCGLSGAVYLVNDIADRESDRQHPLSAAADRVGRLAVSTAWTVALSSRAALAARDSRLALHGRRRGVPDVAGLLRSPKHIVIIDVLTLATGFVLRAIAGAVAVNVEISHWLLVCTILLALFIALAKRRHEIVSWPAARRVIGRSSARRAYLLDQMLSVVTASTLITYIFYTVSPETQEKFGTPWLGLTIPFPLYGIFRYLYLVHQREGGGSPADLLLTDRPLLVCVALWAMAVVLIIYRPL